jgi:hypothetical protein
VTSSDTFSSSSATRNCTNAASSAEYTCLC